MLTNIYDKTTGMPIDFKLDIESESEVETKDYIYTFDDILRLNLENREYLIASCLGQ